MTLPRDILDRVERVREFHQSTKWNEQSAPRGVPRTTHQPTRPSPYRLFNHLPKIALPTKLIDASAPVLSLMNIGLASLPDSQLHPPQDLRTLATWLYMADGVIGKHESDGASHALRSCPSNGLLFPCEIYVAAFGVQDLEPGLYHYGPREFALRKLRDGAATLAQLRRGRPELEFLKSAPAALLVSTIFCRSTWLYQKRGYRAALHDAGHLVQNL